MNRVLRNIVRTREPVVGLDIGATSLKLVELDFSAPALRVQALGTLPMPKQAVQGHFIKSPERVAAAIEELVRQSGCSCKNVSVGLPAGSVFAKPITVPRLPWSELHEHVMLEAGQCVPFDRDSISVDFQVTGRSGPDMVEVLIVAAKNEVIAGYREAVALAGLRTSIVDVDCFALQNCFEFNEPKLLDKSIALIDIGGRAASLHIVSQGRSLRVADVSLLRDNEGREEDDCTALVAEIAQQLSLLCDTEDQEIILDGVRVCGGGAMLPVVAERLSDLLSIPTQVLNPFSQIAVADDLVSGGVAHIAPVMGVATGLALRHSDDQIIPEYLERAE